MKKSCDLMNCRLICARGGERNTKTIDNLEEKGGSGLKRRKHVVRGGGEEAPPDRKNRIISMVLRKNNKRYKNFYKIR